jgi:hypothetical protein
LRLDATSGGSGGSTSPLSVGPPSVPSFFVTGTTAPSTTIWMRWRSRSTTTPTWCQRSSFSPPSRVNISTDPTPPERWPAPMPTPRCPLPPCPRLTNQPGVQM